MKPDQNYDENKCLILTLTEYILALNKSVHLDESNNEILVKV